MVPNLPLCYYQESIAVVLPTFVQLVDFPTFPCLEASDLDLSPFSVGTCNELLLFYLRRNNGLAH